MCVVHQEAKEPKGAGTGAGRAAAEAALAAVLAQQRKRGNSSVMLAGFGGTLVCCGAPQWLQCTMAHALGSPDVAFQVCFSGQ